MARALLMPDAHSSTLKPCGTLILLMGISPGALGAGGCGTGANCESFMASGCPCFHARGLADRRSAVVPSAVSRANRNAPHGSRRRHGDADRAEIQRGAGERHGAWQ